jgi:hypothetical protein
MVSIPQPGSLMGPIGRNRNGCDIFQFLDPQDRQWRYVVRLQDGRLLYSDAAGKIGHGASVFGVREATALAGGAVGLIFFGPIGFLAGAFVGAILGDLLGHRGRL